MKRTVLPNCCEEWIVESGGYYAEGRSFKCLPCGHAWRKQSDGFVEDASGAEYRLVRTLSGFPYLEPVSGPAPVVNRCCSGYLTKHGAAVAAPLDGFACPVCETQWRIEFEPGAFEPTNVFIKAATGDAFVLEESAIAPYLAPVRARMVR